MPDIDHAALKRAALAATQGEWRREDTPDCAMIVAPGARHPVALVGDGPDADYIVAACNAVPELLAERERLREALERLTREAELDGMLARAGWDCWIATARAALAGEKEPKP
jgi:hypothetical protein